MNKITNKFIKEDNSIYFEENFRGQKFRFKTVPGVFSKGKFDVGSRLLLENIKIRDGMTIADLGCGSGVIGLISAKFNLQGFVHLFDVNLRVINLAKENAQINNLSNVEVHLSDLFSALPNQSYDLILSNPAQHEGNDFLEESVYESYKHLKDEGKLVWVIQKHVTPLIKRLFDKHFGNYEVLAHGKDHTVIRAIKVDQ